MSHPWIPINFDSKCRIPKVTKHDDFYVINLYWNLRNFPLLFTFCQRYQTAWFCAQNRKIVAFFRSRPRTLSLYFKSKWPPMEVTVCAKLSRISPSDWHVRRQTKKVGLYCFRISFPFKLPLESINVEFGTIIQIMQQFFPNYKLF